MALEGVRRNTEIQQRRIEARTDTVRQENNRQTTGGNTSGNVRRGETNLYAAQFKARLEARETERNNLLAPTVAGANGARRIYTSTAEKYGFAPRTAESATAARTVADTINQQVAAQNLSTKYRSDNPVTGAMIHEDGSITVTSSGGAKKTQGLYNDLQNKPAVRQAIQDNLNKAFEGNPNIRRNANGDVVWRTGLTETNFTLRPATRRDGTGAIVDTSANSNTCAAGKGYQTNANEAGRVVAADEVWRRIPETKTNADGTTSVVGETRHIDPIKINNADARSMLPCEGCQTNADTLTSGGRVRPQGMTVRSTVNAGATGGAIGAGVETLSQLWDNGGDVTKLDGGRILRETGLGVATGVAGEAIERGATRVITPLAERAVQYGINQGVLRVPTGAATNTATQSLTQRVLGGATNLTSSQSTLLSSNVGKLAGAGVAGGVIGAGVETVRQWDNLQNDRTAADAVGSIAGQAAVGVAAGVAGAQIGAMIGTAIPIPGVGTVAGAAVGFAVGYALSATGVDKAIASGVSAIASATGLDKAAASVARGVTEGFNNAKEAASSFFGGAASRLASVFG